MGCIFLAFFNLQMKTRQVNAFDLICLDVTQRVASNVNDLWKKICLRQKLELPT